MGEQEAPARGGGERPGAMLQLLPNLWRKPHVWPGGALFLGEDVFFLDLVRSWENKSQMGEMSIMKSSINWDEFVEKIKDRCHT